MFLALKARNDFGGSTLTAIFSFLFRAFSASKIHGTLTWGVAPGCRISRPWR